MNENQKMALKQDVAEKYSVTPRTVELWMARGWIPYIKIGEKVVRFDLPAVDRALTERFGSRN